jgi:hypothetical protein
MQYPSGTMLVLGFDRRTGKIFVGVAVITAASV